MCINLQIICLRRAVGFVFPFNNLILQENVKVKVNYNIGCTTLYEYADFFLVCWNWCGDNKAKLVIHRVSLDRWNYWIVISYCGNRQLLLMMRRDNILLTSFTKWNCIKLTILFNYIDENVFKNLMTKWLWLSCLCMLLMIFLHVVFN